MENKEKISRRDALKRMAKTAVIVTVASMFPSENALANKTNMGYSDSAYYNFNYSNSSGGKYVDKCYGDYTNYHNYSNHSDYSNYTNYRDYSNHRDYSNYDNYQNYQNATN